MSRRPSRRRLVLALAALVLSATVVRRAKAHSDPVDIEAGSTLGAHDAHVTCGPDVRVRHAAGGVRVATVVQRTDEERRNGTGLVVDARAGAGLTRVTEVYGAQGSSAGGSTNGLGDLTVSGAAQIAVGGERRTWAWQVGGALYLASAGTLTGQRTIPPPTVEFRVGEVNRGLSSTFGFGLPPVPTLSRQWGAYAMFDYRFEHVGVGLGGYGLVGSELDQRSGVFARTELPVTERVSLGVTGAFDVGSGSHAQVPGFSIGATLRVKLGGEVASP